MNRTSPYDKEFFFYLKTLPCFFDSKIFWSLEDFPRLFNKEIFLRLSSMLQISFLFNKSTELNESNTLKLMTKIKFKRTLVMC